MTGDKYQLRLMTQRKEQFIKSYEHILKTNSKVCRSNYLQWQI